MNFNDNKDNNTKITKLIMLKYAHHLQSIQMLSNFPVLSILK